MQPHINPHFTRPQTSTDDRRTKYETIRSVVSATSFRNPPIACPSLIGFEPKKARNELQRRKLKSGAPGSKTGQRPVAPVAFSS